MLKVLSKEFSWTIPSIVVFQPKMNYSKFVTMRFIQWDQFEKEANLIDTRNTKFLKGPSWWLPNFDY